LSETNYRPGETVTPSSSSANWLADLPIIRSPLRASLYPTNHVAFSCDTVNGRDIPQATSRRGSSRRNDLYCTVLDTSARYRRCAVPRRGRSVCDRFHRDDRISRMSHRTLPMFHLPRFVERYITITIAQVKACSRIGATEMPMTHFGWGAPVASQ
jgi:hypothetical protein